MTRFRGELPLTVVLICSVGSPARANVIVVVSVLVTVEGEKRHFLRAIRTCSAKAGSPDSIFTLTAPEVSTTSRAVTVPCFLARRATAG